MDTAQLDRAHKLERTYQRRASRTRRSKWLGRVLFSLTGVALMLGLRSNPEVVADVVHWAHAPQNGPVAPRTIAKPSDIHVRIMPSDKVPVRRGGTLPGNGTSAPQQDTQTQADAVGNTLRGLSPGG
ncbi:MAG: hypothetical protein AAF214_00720 [Pseudomonadota bacterium]